MKRLLSMSTAIAAAIVLGALGVLFLLSGDVGATQPPPALDSVACPTASECIAVGGSGHVLVSKNKGLTWATQFVPTGHYLYGIACLGGARCIAVGDAGTVLVSGHDNDTWSQVHSGTEQPLSSVACPGDGRCYAVGDGGVVLATQDGGSSWRRVSFGSEVVDGVACGSITRCAAVTSNADQDLRTSDGTSWSAATVPSGPFFALFPMNGISCSGVTCVSVGGHGFLARSTDEGAAWSFVQSAASVVGLDGVACFTVNRCIAVGSGGAILTTNDGGAKWVHDPSPTNETLLGVSCSKSGDCLAVGGAATVLSTIDGGANWVIRNGTEAPQPQIVVLVVGDSFSHTLALYVGRNSAAYGITLIDGGIDGCALARGNFIGGSGTADQVDGPCARTGPGWPAVYQAEVSKDRPDLSLLVLGPWDLAARLIDGKWSSPGQPTYDAYYRGQVATAIRVLTAYGGRVAITTMPYIRISGSERCDPVPATVRNCPTETERVTALDAIAREVAVEYPGRVTLIELGQRLSPGGRFTRTVDGVVVRAADGVHLSEPGGEWLTPWLVPRIISADH